MRVWITGGGGFIGSHLAPLLLEKGYEVISTYYPKSEKNKKIPGVFFEECDIRDKERVYFFLKKFKPEKIFHLAAQSLPSFSWKDPWYTIETNIIGTLNLFEGIRAANLNPKVLVACSSAEYGYVEKEEIPVKETHSLKPLHPYGVSKVGQELLSYQYYKNFGINSIALRIFNTTGPGKTNDVCSDFTKRLVEIEKGINKEKKLVVGNLETKRAITDVRDVVKALDLALDKATFGEVYNLSGEKTYQIQEIVEILKKLVNFDFSIDIDKNLLRPSDEPVIFGDTTKFKKETNWKQEIHLEKTLQDMLDYWRNSS